MRHEDYDVVIVGAGAAGLSAAIYSGRSGLSTIVLEKSMVGGQTSLSPLIENYPGFASASGPDIIERFKEHAGKYARLKELSPVNIVRSEENVFMVETAETVYRCRGLILSTGAVHRKLDVPGEKEYTGRGVSYCATCDGFFFKDRNVVVVGGGNTALTEAIYLLGMGCSVTLVHRRDKLRAEALLEKEFLERGGMVEWNTVVESIEGDENVSGVVLKNVVDASSRTLEAEGVFVAVGIKPNNELGSSLGVNMDSEGYIIVDRAQRTNIPRVYAAGDNCIGLRQVVTGAAEGAVAAVSAHQDITHRQWGQ